MSGATAKSWQIDSGSTSLHQSDATINSLKLKNKLRTSKILSLDTNAEWLQNSDASKHSAYLGCLDAVHQLLFPEHSRAVAAAALVVLIAFIVIVWNLPSKDEDASSQASAEALTKPQNRITLSCRVVNEVRRDAAGVGSSIKMEPPIRTLAKGLGSHLAAAGCYEGTWSRKYRTSNDTVKAAINMLLQTHIISEEEFAHKTVDENHINECISIALEMLEKQKVIDVLQHDGHRTPTKEPASLDSVEPLARSRSQSQSTASTVAGSSSNSPQSQSADERVGLSPSAQKSLEDTYNTVLDGTCESTSSSLFADHSQFFTEDAEVTDVLPALVPIGQQENPEGPRVSAARKVSVGSSWSARSIGSVSTGSYVSSAGSVSTGSDSPGSYSTSPLPSFGGAPIQETQTKGRFQIRPIRVVTPPHSQVSTHNL